MNLDERVKRWEPVGTAIARLLAPHGEVVLHDARTDRVLAVWNPLSRRRRGDHSLLGELDQLEPAAEGVYGPYEKLLPDGRRLSSVSAVVRDGDGAPELLICVNFDRTPLDQAATMLSAFAAPVAGRPEVLFEHDWAERINQIVGAFVRDRGRPVEQLSREERLEVLAELDRAGVFSVRRAAPLVARALRISRSGFYALLADLRNQGSAP